MGSDNKTHNLFQIHVDIVLFSELQTKATKSVKALKFIKSVGTSPGSVDLETNRWSCADKKTLENIRKCWLCILQNQNMTKPGQNDTILAAIIVIAWMMRCHATMFE